MRAHLSLPSQNLTALTAQRGAFTAALSKLGTVASKVPAINQLLTAIRRKKSKARASLRGTVPLRARVWCHHSTEGRLPGTSPCPVLPCAQDTVILSTVVAGCCIFLLWYVWAG